MKDSCEWLNFRWGLDVSYTKIENAPILVELCKKHKQFWDGEFMYRIQGNQVILRWPDWRSHYRVHMEKVRLRHHQSHKQTKLTYWQGKSPKVKQATEDFLRSNLSLKEVAAKHGVSIVSINNQQPR